MFWSEIRDRCWIGTSAENQQSLDYRWPSLASIGDAPIRWFSLEPLLEPIIIPPAVLHPTTGAQWFVVGGESGPNARPFNIAWAESIIEQCRSAGVPCFVKQLGADPFTTEQPIGRLNHFFQPGDWNNGEFRPRMKDKKGGDMSEWPEFLRVREMPERK